MPRWFHIAAVFLFNLATLSRAAITIRDSRHWTPETDRTIFLRPANGNEFPLSYADIFVEIDGKPALIVKPEDSIKAAFVVGSKNQEGNNTLWEPVIEVSLNFKGFPEKNRVVSVTFTLLTRKGESDITINFVETFPGEWGCSETRQTGLVKDIDYPIRIYKNGTVLFNDKIVSDTQFNMPFHHGYEYVALNGTQEQLIPFSVTHTFSDNVYVVTDKKRFALPFPDNWSSGAARFTPRRNFFTETPGEASEGDGEGEEEGESDNDGSTKATAKAGFSDWYYIIIIVAVFLVFMVALGVVLFIKKRMKDKKRRESENRRLAPSVSSQQQQQPSVEQEPPAGSAMGAAN
uniref:DUF4382 domain-containing protein n=1 Tax=Panagrellus redivivus TaxID=6233 RepID=A0A7E4VXN2_PANRE